MKANFVRVSCGSINFPSTWSQKQNIDVNEIGTQTPASLYRVSDAETQCGLLTEIYQYQAKSSDAGKSIVECLPKVFPKCRRDWKETVNNGYVTVDCEVVTDEHRLENEQFIEYVDARVDIGTGTDALIGDQAYDDQSLLLFLHKTVPIVLEELEFNCNSKAFDGFEADEFNMNDETFIWKKLTVDLEKKKVIFPDWSSAKHCPGVISRCIVTRIKERVYDIEFEDGLRYNNVREEHIRLIDANTRNSRSEKTGSKLSYREGVRVHAKVTYKNGSVKFLPGRISRCNRSGTYDVECEGGRMELGLSADDLMIGLLEGQQVEARRPSKIHLQCTGLSWSSTGRVLAASYGRTDISGWCDYPGAVCVWNVYAPSADDPEFVLDHTCCLTCVQCHPSMPALVAAGSFNGEVIVWDLTDPEKALALSPVFEYSHKEVVTDIKWIKKTTSTVDNLDDWVIISAGADGKILTWSCDNSFKNPVNGVTVGLKNSTKSSRKHYPFFHGVSCLAFSETQAVLNDNNTLIKKQLQLTKWMFVGQEGGGILRAPLTRVISGNKINTETLKNFPLVEEIYPSLWRLGEVFVHDAHIGPVTCIDCSSFQRNIFLTGGSDGCIRMYNMLYKNPIRQWEPSPSPGTLGVTGAYSPITAVKFSHVRPSVFAATSSDGFLYIFDLSRSLAGPVAKLEALAYSGDNITKEELRNYKGAGSESQGRIGLTSVCFNKKRMELIAACDVKGQVHIWKLNRLLTAQSKTEMSLLNELSSSTSDRLL